jgi:hypothetical protein
MRKGTSNAVPAQSGRPRPHRRANVRGQAVIRTAFLRLERDEELRRRVMIKVRRSGILAVQASTAYGLALDELAELCDLRRRIVEDCA